jgi:Flp pilus assembly protein TadG
MKGQAMTTKTRGVALVEFALILPTLLILTFVTTEFGRALYQYNTLAKSVRDGARYLSIQLPNTHLTEARNLIVYGNTAGTGQALAQGLATSHVPDPTWQTAGTAPEIVISTVRVEVTGYTFNSLIPSVFGLNIGSYTFPTISATMRSHL